MKISQLLGELKTTSKVSNETAQILQFPAKKPAAATTTIPPFSSSTGKFSGQLGQSNVKVTAPPAAPAYSGSTSMTQTGFNQFGQTPKAASNVPSAPSGAAAQAPKQDTTTPSGGLIQKGAQALGTTVGAIAGAIPTFKAAYSFGKDPTKLRNFQDLVRSFKGGTGQLTDADYQNFVDWIRTNNPKIK